MDINLLNTIRQLQKENNKTKIISTLQDFLNNKDTKNNMDIGWAYWSISDNYAMLRMADEELKNHIKFLDFVNKELPKEMLFWPVSDGTQKATLIQGGYGDFWFDLYQTACNTAPKTSTNLGIRFESHRAAVALKNPNLGKPNKRISEFALNNMKNLIEENPLDYNIKFYTITYYSLLLITKEIQSETLDKAMNSFDALVPYLDLDNKKKDYYDIWGIWGTWEHLNSKRSMYNQARVGINNFIINLIDISQHRLALECYKVFTEKGISTNDYLKSRIEYAKSNL
ncbi:MAG: hypothetical protein GX962_04535 [Epulopiscium sp.]|nr:hypothetical protein [Candidatus Epulonipiscium sp.]